MTESWPIEVYGHDGTAHNCTLEPGDLLLYESHTVLHGRPFPLQGEYYANVFVHYKPIDHDRINDEDPRLHPHAALMQKAQQIKKTKEDANQREPHHMINPLKDPSDPRDPRLSRAHSRHVTDHEYDERDESNSNHHPQLPFVSNQEEESSQLRLRRGNNNSPRTDAFRREFSDVAGFGSARVDDPYQLATHTGKDAPADFASSATTMGISDQDADHALQAMGSFHHGRGQNPPINARNRADRGATAESDVQSPSDQNEQTRPYPLQRQNAVSQLDILPALPVLPPHASETHPRPPLSRQNGLRTHDIQAILHQHQDTDESNSETNLEKQRGQQPAAINNNNEMAANTDSLSHRSIGSDIMLQITEKTVEEKLSAITQEKDAQLTSKEQGENHETFQRNAS